MGQILALRGQRTNLRKSVQSSEKQSKWTAYVCSNAFKSVLEQYLLCDLQCKRYMLKSFVGFLNWLTELLKLRGFLLIILFLIVFFLWKKSLHIL